MYPFARIILALSIVAIFSGSAVPAAATIRFTMTSHTGRPVVYAAEYFGYYENVAVFDEVTGARIAQLVLPSEGSSVYVTTSIGVDAAHNVYVGTQYDNETFFVSVYAPRASRPSRTFKLRDSANLLAVAPNGELAVVPQVTGGATIDLFAPGANSPTSIVKSSSLLIRSVSFGADGTLWAFGQDNHNVAAFGKVAPGGTTLLPEFEVRGAEYSLFAIDGSGNLALSKGAGVVAYTTAGAPVYQFHLGGTPAGPTALEFSSDGKSVFLGDPYLSIEVFPSPQGGLPTRSFGFVASAVAVGSI